jgi:hypothetical protein
MRNSPRPAGPLLPAGRAAGPRDPRSGIALVIVLGMMALLMILAVGFFVAMRTERLAARSYADEIRARQMAHAAITRAMADVDVEISAANRVIPLWPNEVRVSPGGGAFPSLSTNMTGHVPGFVLAAVNSQANTAGWITAPHGNGQFAYMVVNVSGFLDPNRDYSVTNSTIFPRFEGYDANEIAYEHAQIATVLTELTPNAINAARMIKGRVSTAFRTKPYLRAETVPDLWIVGRYQYGGVTPLLRYPESFFPYSYFPIGYRDATGLAQAPLNIGGTSAQVAAQRAQIETQFTDMGLNATDAAYAAINLIDYLDDTSLVPGMAAGLGSTGPNCDNFATKAVPMLNQFMIRTAFGPPVSGVRPLTVEVKAQVWYPFVNTTNLPFGLKVQAEVVGEGYSAVTPTAPPPVLLGNDWSQNTFATNQVNFLVQTTSTNFVPTAVIIRELAIVDAQNRVVDRVCGPDRPVTLDSSFLSYQAATPRISWWWVGDPRINWLWDPLGPGGGRVSHWRLGARRVTDATGGPSDWMDKHPSVVGEYGRFEMYVRNQGNLRTVGELGLMVGREGVAGVERSPVEWQTIRLLGTGALPVLDRFTVHTNALRGIVNPNTMNHRSVAAVLLDAPLERWPGEPAAPRLTAAQALQAATEVRDAHVTSQFLNRSDLSRVNFTVGADDAQREGLLRNSAQLLSPRQNLFLVIVRGRAMSTSGNVTMGEAQAIALVWRDPYRNAVTGNHQTRIRWIRWMEE